MEVELVEMSNQELSVKHRLEPRVHNSQQAGKCCLRTNVMPTLLDQEVEIQAVLRV